MAFSYTGDPTKVNVNNVYSYPALPNDGDQATGVSVTSPFIKCSDQDAFLIRQDSYTRVRSTMSTTSDYTGINISDIPPICIFDQFNQKWFYYSKAATTITKAQLEVPGNFTGGSTYYIYLTIKVAGTLDYVISTDAPDVYRCYKNSGAANPTQFRYVGSFIASGLSTINPFTMADFDYDFIIPLGTNYSNTNFQQAFDTPAILALDSPGTARTIKFIFILNSNGPDRSADGAAWFFDIRELGATSSNNTYWPGFRVPSQFIVAAGSVVPVQTYATKECASTNGTFEAINFNKVGANAPNNSLIRIWWNGYKE